MRDGITYYSLGSICTSVNGYTPSAELLNTHGRYPYFKVAEMNLPANQKVMTETTAFVDNPTKIYRKGTVVFPKNGAAISTNKKRILGQDSVIDLNTGGFVVSEDIINVMYFYYIMQHIDFRDYVRRGAVPTLDIKELKSKLIPVPSLFEQQQIVAELDLLSDIIEKKKAQLKELDNLAQSIFYDMFGDPIANEKGWERIPLKGLCKKLFAGGDVPKDNFSKKLTDKYQIPIFSNGVGEKSLYGYTDYARVEEESITISGRGTIGYCMVHSKPFLPVVRLIVATPNPSKMSSLVLKFIVDSLHFTGTGGAIPQLTIPMIKDTLIIVPPLSLQVSFATKIEAIEKQKSAIRKSIEEAQTLFDSRMDFYFN